MTLNMKGGDVNVPWAYSRSRSGLFGSTGLLKLLGGLEAWLSRTAAEGVKEARPDFATGS
jgi:hypothetical protein